MIVRLILVIGWTLGIILLTPAAASAACVDVRYGNRSSQVAADDGECKKKARNGAAAIAGAGAGAAGIALGGAAVRSPTGRNPRTNRTSKPDKPRPRGNRRPRRKRKGPRKKAAKKRGEKERLRQRRGDQQDSQRPQDRSPGDEKISPAGHYLRRHGPDAQARAENAGGAAQMINNFLDGLVPNLPPELQLGVEAVKAATWGWGFMWPGISGILRGWKWW